MARFRGTVRGNRSEASRLGHPSSGLQTECNGWDVGVSCRAYVDDGKDRISVFATDGSGPRGTSELIAVVTRDTYGNITIEHYTNSGGYTRTRVLTETIED